MAESLATESPALAAADAAPGRRPMRSTLRRLVRQPAAAAGLGVLTLLVLASFVGRPLWNYGYAQLTPDSSQGPSGRHPFGTDALGHDLLAQVLRGTERSIEIAIVISVVSTVVGAVWGAVAGYYRGLLGAAMMRVVDVVLMLPVIVLAAVLTEHSGGSWWVIGLLLGGLLAPSVSRVVRSRTLSLREREFVASARAQGASGPRIVARHILPNVNGVIIVSATLIVAAGVLAETSLSFLGFGIHAPDTSLGLLVANAATAVDTRPWLFYFPGLVILLLTLSINFVGDGLRTALDPRAEIGPARRDDRPGEEVGEPTVATDDAGPEPDAVLRIRDLRVTLPRRTGAVRAVRGLDLDVAPGEVVAVVGESGSGKSATALAVLGLLPAAATVTGSVRLHGRELVGVPDADLAAVRGRSVALIPQDPTTALNPVFTVGWQVAEMLRVHGDLGRAQARARAVELLGEVGLSDPAARARQYPRQLSGGMRQRVVIAMAIANRPDLIIADEPTTALDVTVQAQILQTLVAAQRRTGAALLLISHNLGVVAGVADRVVVMYAGRPVEVAAVDDLFADPAMPYTIGLLGSLPRIEGDRGRDLTPIRGAQPELVDLGPGCTFAPRCPAVSETCTTTQPALANVTGTRSGHRSACFHADQVVGTPPAELFRPTAEPPAPAAPTPAAEPVLTVADVSKSYRVRGRRRGARTVHALRSVSLDLAPGETLAIAGESGCGKTTLSRSIVGLERPDHGAVRFDGRAVARMSAADRRRYRAELQIVFQDPYASLDPRMSIHEIVAEPLRIHGRYAAGGASTVTRLLGQVGLEPATAARYPHQLSGGQRQRVGIARALALDPRVLVLDEPVSALDASVQAGVLNLLRRLQRELRLAYVFISHDLSVVRHLADRVAVMYLGEIVEVASTDEIFAAPRHPYTRALIAAIPVPDPPRQRERQQIVLAGDPPSRFALPTGCPFRSRCPTFAAQLAPAQRARCETDAPRLAVGDHEDHRTACHFALSGGDPSTAPS